MTPDQVYGLCYRPSTGRVPRERHGLPPGAIASPRRRRWLTVQLRDWWVVVLHDAGSVHDAPSVADVLPVSDEPRCQHPPLAHLQTRSVHYTNVHYMIHLLVLIPSLPAFYQFSYSNTTVFSVASL